MHQLHCYNFQIAIPTDYSFVYILSMVRYSPKTSWLASSAETIPTYLSTYGSSPWCNLR